MKITGRKTARNTIIATALAAVLTLAGCGSSSATSSRTEAGARATITQFADDLQQSKFSDACSLLAPDAQLQVSGNCTAQLGLATAFAGNRLAAALEAARSEPVQVSGDYATAMHADGTTTALVYTGGHWLIGRDQVAR